MQFYDKLVSFDNTVGGDLQITHSQELPDEWLSKLKRDKIDPDHNRAGEQEHLFSIPVSVVELWLRAGFDVHRESEHAILRRLQNEGLDAFIVTNRRI